MTKRRRGSLSEDDLALWRRVAQSTTPLEKRPNLVPTAALEGMPAPLGGPATKSPEAPDLLHPFRIGETSSKTPARSNLVPSIERSLASIPVRMDKKTFGKMKKGKLKPERKLDLHGMTLADAHPRLNAFIRDAHAAGCRLVIVVTGKGRSGKDEGGPIPTPRGVLRHQVPGWLQAVTLQPFVLQVTDAHVRHGGSGAYYVYLRRQPGVSGMRD